MRKLLAVVALGAAPLAAACSFLLDFESLQGGATDAGGASGGSGGGSAGSAGSAGAAGNGCGSCDDNDACTRDECDSTGAAPKCRHYTYGAVTDDLDATVEAQVVLRTTLTANGKGFYGSVFASDGSVTDVGLVAFGPTGTTFTQGPKYSDLTAFVDLATHQPMSAIGMVAEDRVPFYVLGYFAIDQGTNQPGKVFRLTMDQNLGNIDVKPASATADYVPDSAYSRHPVAWGNTGGDTFGAWIGADGLVHVDSSASLLGFTLGNAAKPPTAIAPLTNVNGTPGVIWFSDVPYAQIRGQGATALSFCDSHGSGFYLSAASSWFTLPGSWVLLSTRTDTTLSYVATESHLVTCGASSCTLEDHPCNQGVDPVTFNPTIAASTRQQEPGVVYEALAEPSLDASSNDTVVHLDIIRIDFNKLQAGNLTGAVLPLTPQGGIEIARANSGLATTPNWPAIAISGADKIGVSWQQPNPSSGKQEAHFRRYRMCFATPDDEAAVLADGGG